MSEPQGYAPSWCAEFPNDNPSLHDGASWICLSVGGPLRPVTRARPASVLGSVADGPGRTPECVPPAVQTLPPAEALLASETASEADVPPSVQAPGLVEALAAEPLELDGMDAAEAEPPPPLELDGIDATPASGPCGEPLELDAIAWPGSGWISDAVFDFDSDANDAAGPPSVEGDVGRTFTADNAVPADRAADADATSSSVEPVQDAASSAVEPPSDDAASSAFGAYVAALIDVALAAGHTRAAAMLPRLVGGNALDGVELPEEVEQRLVAADVLVRHGDVVSASESFTAVATAWRSVLSGATNDLAVCGDSTLDGWSADLLRAFGIGQGAATEVRRELRRRGVAAFGMLQAA